MRFTEEQLKRFAEPLSTTEDDQCQRAINMIKESLEKIGYKKEGQTQKKYSDLPYYKINMASENQYDLTIFVQGSHANNTNVKGDSDIDIAVVRENVFRGEYRTGISGKNYGFQPATHDALEFKKIIFKALYDKFGNDTVRKNKSILIKGNYSRKQADVVPSLRYRNYKQDYYNDENNFKPGVLITTDDGQEIINYPEIHLENGRRKNINTNYYFKKIVRIMKELKYLMEEEGYNSASKINSFLIESLLWNVPDVLFLNEEEYSAKFIGIVNYLLDNKESIIQFKEVNGIKLLIEDDEERLEISKNFLIDLLEFCIYEE